jgi:hypothetical protein
MATQKSVTVLSVHNGTVFVEYDDHSYDRFPLTDFPHNLKVGDRVKLGLVSSVTYAIIVNGEDVPSTSLERSWNGYVLSFTSTSDRGYVALEEEGDDLLHVIYRTDSKSISLGKITAEWDGSHTFAVLSFSPNATEAGICFKYLTGVIHDPVQLFFDYTAFYVESDKDTVEAVVIKDR